MGFSLTFSNERVTRSSETSVRLIFPFDCYSEITLCRICLPAKFPSEQARSTNPLLSVLCLRGYLCPAEVLFYLISTFFSYANVSQFRVGLILIYVFIWSNFIYNPIAHLMWVWPIAWRCLILPAVLHPIHISSRSAALAIFIYLEKVRAEMP